MDRVVSRDSKVVDVGRYKLMVSNRCIISSILVLVLMLINSRSSSSIVLIP